MRKKATPTVRRKPAVEITPAYDITSFELSRKLSKLGLSKKGLVYYNKTGKIISFDDLGDECYPAYCLEQLLDIIPGELEKIPLLIRKHLLVGYMEKCSRSPLGYIYLCCEPVRYRESLVETFGRLIIRLYHDGFLVSRIRGVTKNYIYKNLLCE